MVTDIAGLERRKPRDVLVTELQAELAGAATPEERRVRLNAFKDREMFRADMRHILGQDREFGQFSEELGDVAEVVVAAALDICRRELEDRYGAPQRLGRAEGAALRLCLGQVRRTRAGLRVGHRADVHLR